MADFSITGEVKLNSDPAEKSVSKWTVAAGQMIADFAKQAASKLSEVVKSGVQYNATMQSYLTNFQVMLGSEEQAAQKLAEIRKMAAATPFSLSDLTNGTQTLLQFGIAADDTTGVLKKLGDISLGNADKMQTLVRAYGKMSSAQKVTLENVNMMIDAGFNPLNQICDATGETMSALYQRITDGKVPFSELEAAVEAATSQGGQFFNGMLEASQTFTGRLSTLKDNAAALTGQLTDGLFAALGDLVVKANEVAVSFLEDDEKLSQLKETLGVATAVVAAAATAVLTYKGYVALATAAEVAHTAATTAMTAAQKAAEAGATGLKLAQAALNGVLNANPIGLVVSGLAALAAGLVTAYHTSETFRNGVNAAFTAVRSMAQTAIGTVVDWINELVARIRGAAAALANLKNGVGAAKDAYDAAYGESMDSYRQSKREKAAQERKRLHEERVRQAQEEKAAADALAAASSHAAAAADANAKTTVSAAKTTVSAGKTAAKAAEDTAQKATQAAKQVAQSTTRTVSGMVEGIATSTKTVTEVLTDGTTQQKRTITQTYDEVVDGALVTVEKVTTIAADGTRQVAEQIKESAADSFDGLWAELQAQANDGVLGTFDELYKAVKNKNWAQVGQWVAATLYNGLAADQKKQIADFALGLVDKLNEALGQVQGQVAQAAWDLGSQLCQGVTSGFSQILAQAKTLGGTLTGIFKGLKEPLSTAALAISQGLSGGLLSAFPAIYAGMGTMIGSVGAAFEGMLTAISAALNATVFGIPMGVIVAGAAVALGVAIAAIVAGLGGRKGSSSRPSGGSGGSGGGSSGSLGSVDITTGTGSLEEAITANTAALTKTNAALADMIRQAGALVLSDNMRLGSTVAASGTAQVAAAASSYHREGDTTINQYIQSKAQTAADLARETRWEADKARRDKR